MSHKETTGARRGGVASNRWTLGTIGFILVLLALVLWVQSYNNTRKETQAKQQAVADSIAVARATVAPTVEALVLMRECLTPCSVNINYRSRILRSDPIKIKFQNVADWIKYPAKGDVTAPKEATSGETQFVSTDPAHPHVRVQIYKKITVLGGQ